MIFKTRMEKRNGKEYMMINSVCSGSDASLIASNIAFDLQYENLPLEMTAIANRVVNAHWRTFKRIVDSSVDKLIEEMCEIVFAPVFNEMPIHDFFQIETKL